MTTGEDSTKNFCELIESGKISKDGCVYRYTVLRYFDAAKSLDIDWEQIKIAMIKRWSFNSWKSIVKKSIKIYPSLVEVMNGKFAQEVENNKDEQD